jgi:hypothetical protein
MKSFFFRRLFAAACLALGLAVCSCATQQTVVQVPTSVNLPKKVKVVAQSCDANALYQTVIDLENNEIVILVYNSKNLLNVIRTGIQADPTDQPAVTGTDAPGGPNSQEKLKYGGK